MRRISVLTIAVVACTNSAELGPRPGTLERVTPANVTAVVGTEIGPAPTVQVKDQNGNPLAGIVVTFSVALNSGYLVDDSLETGADGTATAGKWIAGPQAGSQTLFARSAGLATVMFTAEARAGPVATLQRLLGDKQFAVEGTALGNPLSVKVVDSYANAVEGVEVTFAVIAGDGSIVGDTATTDAAGIATSGVWTVGRTGSQQVRARSGSAEVVFNATACVSLTWGCAEFDSADTTLAFSRDGQLYRVALDGSQVVQMVFNDNVWSSAWSPDGSRIAFSRYGAGGNAIYLLKAGGEVTALTTSDNYYSPAWSPDGRKLALSGWQGLGTSIYVMEADANGTNPTYLTSGSSPSWSPDGTRIAFSEYGAIHSINADGSGRTQLLAPSAGRAFEGAAWSPDGRSIAFSVYSNCDWDDDCDYGIGVLDLGTSEVREIVRGSRPSSYAWSPVWSPDGSMIAFTRLGNIAPGCTPCVSTVRSDGTGERVLVANGQSPSWRP